MNVTTLRRDLEAFHGTGEVDHRARHIANARQWCRQYLDCLEGKCAPGAKAQTIWNAMLRECQLANVDPDTILPAAYSLN